MSNYLAAAIDLDDATIVSAYDDLPLWSALAGQLFFEHVPLRAGITALDVGCGTGFPAIELAERLGPNAVVHGLDPWAAALVRARAKAKARGVAHVIFDQGDAARMPYADLRFDLVVSNLGLNNFPDPDAATAECRRVLRPRGLLALTTNLVGHMSEFYEVMARVLVETGAEREAGALERHIASRATLDGVQDLLGRHGFAVTRIERSSVTLRYADGTALLRHWFVRLGFVGEWRATITPARQDEVFARIEEVLPRPLRLTVPFAYVEAAAI